MKTTIKLAMSIGLGMFMLAAMPTLASAQEDISQKQIPSLELEQADVREALRALFKNVNVSYSIAPEVQGSVTVSLKNVTFETALQHVLRQVDATYRVEAGVYEIVKKVETVVPAGTPTDQKSIGTSNLIIRRIKIRSADPAFIAAMIGSKGGSQQYTTSSPERSTIAKTPPSSSGGFGGGGGIGGGGGMNGGGFGGGGNMGGGGFGNSGGFGGGSSFGGGGGSFGGGGNRGGFGGF